MDAKLVKYSSNQQVSPYMQQKVTTPKKVTTTSRVFNSKPSENLVPTRIHGYPLLNHPMPHPSLSFSCSSHAHFSHLINYQQQQQQKGQPPLLPLPSMTKPYNSFPSRNQHVSCPPTNKNIKKGSKKSKLVKKEYAKPSKANWDASLNSSKTPVGPEPNELPRDVFSSIVAPPPSSLPLPKFSMIRPKFTCREAVGGDACASDELRRILRIR